MDGTRDVTRLEATSIEGAGHLRTWNGHLRGLLHCIPQQISPDRSIS